MRRASERLVRTVEVDRLLARSAQETWRNSSSGKSQEPESTDC
jgi:hypothetical protein